MSKFKNTSITEIIGSVILVTGARGTGKTALCYHILEQMSGERDAYVIGLPEEKWEYLPDFIFPLTDISDLPCDSIVFTDEAALIYHSRDHSRSLNKQISKLVTETRHKNQILVFASHTLRKLDLGIILDSDSILFKKPSFLHSRFERAEIRSIVDNVSRKFAEINDRHEKYTYVLAQNYEGMITTPLPSFWCEELSKISRVSKEQDMLFDNSTGGGVSKEIFYKYACPHILNSFDPELFRMDGVLSCTECRDKQVNSKAKKTET